MAFMGIVMMYLVIIVFILLGCASTCAVCFIVSGVIMAMKRRKRQGNEHIKQPWYVILLRVVGTLAAIPLVLFAGLIVYALIANAIDKNTNLARAVMNYDFEQTRKILDNGADPDERDKYGNTLLMCLANQSTYISQDGTRYQCDYAEDGSQADEDDMKMMGLLLEYGADINAQKSDCGYTSSHEYGDEGWNSIYANSEHSCQNTALIDAVKYRSPEIISFLIENGADVNIANACGFTPALMCADNRCDDDDGAQIITILIDAGADLNAVSNFHQDIRFLLYRHMDENVEEMQGIVEGKLDN